ncbi:MAG: hypothetical protein JSW24_05600 [Dehalococcoidia bacterium]|nr:MAG: hypothetical protein JSW24_05600 [Dehalococcoidia bacterium]
MSRVKDERIPLLEVKDSVKDFPGVRALDKVSFYLYAGEVLSIEVSEAFDLLNNTSKCVIRATCGEARNAKTCS